MLMQSGIPKVCGSAFPEDGISVDMLSSGWEIPADKNGALMVSRVAEASTIDEVAKSSAIEAARSRPPFALAVVAALVAVIGCGMALAGANSTGISVDDPRHVTRLNVYFETGLYNTGKELKEAGEAIPDQTYVYGPVTALLQHAGNRVIGREDAGHAKRRADAYTVRHLVIAGIGAIGLLAAGVIAWLLLGDWRWGLVAAGTLAAVPMWTGHSMFNMKDIPVAVGHTLATLGLVLIARSENRASRWSLAAAAIALVAGSVLMLGTRPGMWPSLAASVTLLIAILWWSRLRRREFWVVLAVIFGSLATAYGLLYAIYPRVFANPVQLLWESATASADYPHQDGVDRAYVPLHMAQEWPLILLGLFGVGTVVAIVRSTRLLQERSLAATGFLLVGSQAFTLQILIVIHNSQLYQGLRQVLFAVPAQAVLATVGLATLISAAQSKRTRGLWATVGGLGLILPMAVQAAMFPYQYVYNNVAAEVVGVNADNDYLGTSYREYVTEAPGDIKIVCPQRSTKKLVRSLGDCRTRSRGQLSPYWKASGRPALDTPKDDEFYALQKGNWALPNYCKEVHEITRWRNLGRTTISRMVECKPPDNPQSTGRSGS